MNMHPIKAYRRQHGLTQSQLADRLGCSQGHIALVENGKRGLGKDMARAWAEHTGIALVDLLWPDGMAA